MLVRVMNETETLGQYLKRKREDAGFRSPEKVEDKARQSGLRARGRTIRQIEGDHVGRPEAETLEVLAALYGLDYHDLLRRAGYMRPEEDHPPSGTASYGEEIAELIDAMPPEQQEAAMEILRASARLAKLGQRRDTGG